MVVITLTAFAQKNFYDYDTVNGVIIKYNLYHSNSKDPSSRLNLSFHMTNTNDYTVTVIYNVEVHESNGKYASGKQELSIKPKAKQAGKISNLCFELKTNDLKEFEDGDSEWFFKQLDIFNPDDPKKDDEE